MITQVQGPSQQRSPRQFSRGQLYTENRFSAETFKKSTERKLKKKRKELTLQTHGPARYVSCLFMYYYQRPVVLGPVLVFRSAWDLSNECPSLAQQDFPFLLQVGSDFMKCRFFQFQHICREFFLCTKFIKFHF